MAISSTTPRTTQETTSGSRRRRTTDNCGQSSSGFGQRHSNVHNSPSNVHSGRKSTFLSLISTGITERNEKQSASYQPVDKSQAFAVQMNVWKEKSVPYTFNPIAKEVGPK